MAALTGAFFASAASAAFAQLRPIDAPRVQPPGGIRAVAYPSASPAPNAPATKLHARIVAPGTRVPLAMLPRLPLRTLDNTISRARLRPMSADGSTITLTTGAGCTGTTGALYNTGCAVTYIASGVPSATDSYQYYVVAPNVGSSAIATGTFTGAPTNQGPQTLNVAGVWTFGLYDATTNAWETVVYVNAGAATTVKAYQDAFYSTETYQYDVSSSSRVYVQVNGVSSADTYVTYMESTSVNPHCVYMAPSPGVVSSSALCNPTSALSGQPAVGGVLDVNWPISASYAGGTYSIVVYDKTTNTRIGQTQVSFTPSTGITMRLTSDGTNANPSPRPLAVPAQGTSYAWDSSNDQSTSGVTLSSAALAASPVWTVSDPTGHVVGTQSGGTSYTFNFNPNALTPGGYAPKVFTATLYDSSTKSVLASQSFQMLGYYAGTFFNQGSGKVTGISVPLGSSTSTSLIFENDSASNFGAANSDGFREIEFTTGSDFTATDGPGAGVYSYISGTACAAACTQTGTVNDTAGNTWNVTDTCAAPSPGFFTTVNGECSILLVPQNPNVVLAPGASITLTNVLFTHDFFSSCLGFFGYGTNSCPGSTSVLPQHGLTWSNINKNDAGNNVTFNQNIFTSESGTAAISLAGAINGATTVKTPQVNAHFYKGYSTQVAYARTSPYSVGTNAFNIYKVVVNNTSSNDAVQTVAIGLPGSYGTTTPSSNNFRQDTAYGAFPAGWTLQVPCPNSSAYGSQGQYICIDGTAGGVSIPAGGSQTFYIDANPPTTSFITTEWQVASVSPYVYQMTPSAVNLTIPVGGTAPLTVDSLALSMYSLDQSLMGATFSPSSAGQGTAPAETVTFTNTTAGADANPDYVDNVLIATNAATVSANPTTTNAGWSYVGPVVSGGTTYWWFSACKNAQNTVANLPPAVTPLTAVPPQITACTSAQLVNALAPGQSLKMGFAFNTLSMVGTVPFSYYAHGANAGGWTTAGSFGLGVTAVSANAGFVKAGGYPTATAVVNGTTPTIGGNADPVNGNAYSYTIKNTSNTNNITYMRIVVPGTDASGANATDASNVTWTITGTGPAVTGSTDGCTVTSYASATTAGANGYIDIGKTVGSACALKPGDTLTVTFTALSPSAQNDSYQFPVINMNNAGITAGENWQYDTYVNVSLSVGLSVVVNPANPGPGSSVPNPNCPAAYPCSFSGTTIDFGTVPASTTNAYTDVVRSSVYITSGATVTWKLYVDTNNNPARTGAGATNELLTDVDAATSTNNPTHITFDQTTYAVVPAASPGLLLANGTNVVGNSTPLDLIQNFELSLGTEPVAPQNSVVTYTLIAN